MNFCGHRVTHAVPCILLDAFSKVSALWSVSQPWRPLFCLTFARLFSSKCSDGSEKTQFEALADANEQLQIDINRLNTSDGVIAAARSELGYVFPGEQRIQLLAMPALPTTLPTTWPYTLVTDILRVRAANIGSASGGLAPLSR